MFALTMIASLASGSLWKGLAGGALGMLFGTIGIAPALAHARFTFGVPGLLGGLSMVASLVGLFAIPQALRLVEGHRERPRIVEYRESRGVFAAVARELVLRPMTLIRSSVIGTIVGILPAAPASMIPLLALGVPGSPPAAVALGALLLHGLRPGRSLYAEHADIVYTFIWSTILAGLVIMVISMLLSRYLVRIAAFPVHVLAPLILLFGVVGSFAIRNNVLDVAVMLSFGLLGYLLDKLAFSAGPIVLGLILGPIVESGLVSSLALVGTGRSWMDVFLFRPISAALILLTLLSVAWPMLSRRLLPSTVPVTAAVGGDE